MSHSDQHFGKPFALQLIDERNSYDTGGMIGVSHISQPKFGNFGRFEKYPRGLLDVRLDNELESADEG